MAETLQEVSEDDQWTCKRCTLWNDNSCNRCLACEESRLIVDTGNGNRGTRRTTRRGTRATAKVNYADMMEYESDKEGGYSMGVGKGRQGKRGRGHDTMSAAPEMAKESTPNSAGSAATKTVQLDSDEDDSEIFESPLVEARSGAVSVDENSSQGLGETEKDLSAPRPQGRKRRRSVELDGGRRREERFDSQLISYPPKNIQAILSGVYEDGAPDDHGERLTLRRRKKDSGDCRWPALFSTLVGSCATETGEDGSLEEPPEKVLRTGGWGEKSSGRQMNGVSKPGSDVTASPEGPKPYGAERTPLGKEGRDEVENGTQGDDIAESKVPAEAFHYRAEHQQQSSVRKKRSRLSLRKVDGIDPTNKDGGKDPIVVGTPGLPQEGQGSRGMMARQGEVVNRPESKGGCGSSSSERQQDVQGQGPLLQQDKSLGCNVDRAGSGGGGKEASEVQGGVPSPAQGRPSGKGKVSTKTEQAPATTGPRTRGVRQMQWDISGGSSSETESDREGSEDGNETQHSKGLSHRTEEERNTIPAPASPSSAPLALASLAPVSPTPAPAWAPPMDRLPPRNTFNQVSLADGVNTRSGEEASTGAAAGERTPQGRVLWRAGAGVEDIGGGEAGVPEAVTPRGGWSCTACTFLNRARARKCQICHTERTRGDRGTAVAPDAHGVGGGAQYEPKAGLGEGSSKGGSEGGGSQDCGSQEDCGPRLRSSKKAGKSRRQIEEEEEEEKKGEEKKGEEKKGEELEHEEDGRGGDEGGEVGRHLGEAFRAAGGAAQEVVDREDDGFEKYDPNLWDDAESMGGGNDESGSCSDSNSDDDDDGDDGGEEEYHDTDNSQQEEDIEGSDPEAVAMQMEIRFSQDNTRWDGKRRGPPRPGKKGPQEASVVDLTLMEQSPMNVHGGRAGARAGAGAGERSPDSIEDISDDYDEEEDMEINHNMRSSGSGRLPRQRLDRAGEAGVGGGRAAWQEICHRKFAHFTSVREHQDRNSSPIDFDSMRGGSRDSAQGDTNYDQRKRTREVKAQKKSQGRRTKSKSKGGGGVGRGRGGRQSCAQRPGRSGSGAGGGRASSRGGSTGAGGAGVGWTWIPEGVRIDKGGQANRGRQGGTSMPRVNHYQGSDELAMDDDGGGMLWEARGRSTYAD